MKRIISLFLVLLTVLTAAVGCGKPSGGGSGSAAEDIDSIKTIGDLYDLKSAEYISYSTSGNIFAYGFKLDGTYYRAIATLPDDIKEAYYGIDYSQENAEEESKKMISSVAIDRVEDLTDKILPQEELDKLIGKTGGELFDDDWYAVFYDYVSLETEMEHGIFRYKICFEGTIDSTEDVDGEEVFRPLTVKSVEFSDLGDLTRDFETDQ